MLTISYIYDLLTFNNFATHMGMHLTSVRDIASQIKVRRKELGWTQSQLAEQSGVSRDWIMAIEKAKPTVELSLVLRTLKALKLHLMSEAKTIQGIHSDSNHGTVEPTTKRS